MESKMTAIKWMVTELENYGDTQVCKITWEDLDSLFEQALEMEKEQIKGSFKHGRLPVLFGSFEAEDYYNETYGKD